MPVLHSMRSVSQRTPVASWVSSFAQLFADHQLQAGPGFVDSADFHIDEAEWKTLGADDVLSDIGLDLRGLLGPRNPDHAGGREALHQQRQRALQFRAL